MSEYSAFDIAPVGTTDLIAVSAESHDARAAAALANAICTEYIQLSLQKNREQLGSAATFVEGQLRAVQQKLSRARAAVEAFKKQTGMVDLQSQAQLAVNRLDALEAEWKQARTEKAATLAQLTELQSMAARMEPTKTVPSSIVRRPAVESMKAQLTQLELDRMTKLREFLPTSPEVKLVDSQIAAIRQRLRQEVQTEIGSWETQVDPVRMQVMQDIARLQGQVWATEARGVALKALVKQAQAQQSRIPEQERRLSQLTNEVTNLQQTHQMLYTKLQSVNITRGARVANASVLFPATAPGGPVGLSPGRTISIVLLLGLLLGVGMAALIDRLDDRIFTEEDAKVVSRLPVLAQVPLLGEQERPYLSIDTPEQASDGSSLLEIFRMLRTMIAYAPVEHSIRSVVVTSSLPHEGKSVNSINLAIAAAMSGENVILIDCDLRGSSIHRLLELPNETGFTSVATGAVPLADALQDTQVPGLRVLTSGPSVTNPFKLLKSRTAHECLQHAVEQSDLVVIDSPPALILADAQVISTFADATLMVISTREASKREIARTRDLLAQTGARVIGALLNKSTVDLDGYSGHYGGSTTSTNQSLTQARKLLFER